MKYRICIKYPTKKFVLFAKVQFFREFVNKKYTKRLDLLVIVAADLPSIQTFQAIVVT